MKITRYVVNHRLATSAIVAALLLFGLYGLWRLPVDLLPSITYPLVKVSVYWRGVPPEEIERGIAEPLERVMSTVDGLDYLESSSIEGQYNLSVNFHPGTDIDIAYQDVLAALNRSARNLPEDVEPPVVYKADPSQLPVTQISFSSDQWDLVRLRSWADQWLQDQLITVPGVAGTAIVGGHVREIRVELDPQKLTKHELSIDRVLKTLKDENLEMAAGRVTTGPHEVVARTVGEFDSVDEIGNVVLARSDNGVVRLHDIASVKDAYEDVRIMTRLNGVPSVTVSIFKQADANTAKVAQGVARKIRALADEMPPGIHFGTFEDQAVYVQSAIDGVRDAALQAALLMIVIVFVFLGSWRQVVVMAVALPLTLVFNFALMKLAGFSLNIFSLGGLVVAIGVLLDNSTVVVENATRLLEERKGTDASDAAVTATGQLGPALLASTLTFLALFLPFLMIPGMTSLLMRELILVVAVITVISLIMAITVTPMLTAWICGRSRPRTSDSALNRMHVRLADLYESLLRRVLTRPGLTFLPFAALLLTAALLLPKVGSEFLPKIDDGRIMVKAKLPSGASLGSTDSTLRQIENILKSDPLIESAFALTGGQPKGLMTYEVANEGQVDVQLVGRKHRKISTKNYVGSLRKKIAQLAVPGARIMVKQKSVRGIHGMGKSDIEVKVRGADYRQLFSIAQRASNAMRKQKDLAGVSITADMQKPEYRVIIDRERASLMGVSVAQVAGTVRSFIDGAVSTRFRETNEYYGIRVVAPAASMQHADDIGNLLIDLPGESHTRLYDLARIEKASGPVEIARENQVSQITIEADVNGTNVGAALASLQRALGNLEMPSGYSIHYGGQAPLMTQMRSAMILIILLALFFAFVVLIVQFNNLRLPALVLSGMPFCIAGAVFALLFTSTPISVTAIVGLLLVLAASVNDGVLLFTFADELRFKKKLSSRDAVREAGRIRFRPRVMTTITTMAGLIPLAMGLEIGADLLRPMAIGAIGGLVLEMAVALFLMPVFYLWGTRKQQNAM
ncbi:MAG: efflux RND transporter permease subunit [Chitinispirillaceae bacterium]